ncbi:MAG: hypothetical protein K8R21_07855 [Leptospira sp.]|nr:hypothetical protein [Leptospira sp.]
MKNKKILNMLFVISFFSLGYCDLPVPAELKVKEIILCDNFNSKGECTEKKEPGHTYTVTIPKERKVDTWEKLANYLYFHARETPGFLITFNRKLTLTEQKKIKDTYKASFNFGGTTGHVEGFESGENWVGSFQYLGSMIKDRQRERKLEKTFPFPNSLFPVELKYSYTSGIISGEISTKINLILK